MNKSSILNLLWAIGRVYIGVLTMFNYHERWKGFPQFMLCGEKHFQLELVKIQKNSKNFMTNF
jgi:hypothetical protein